MFQNMTMLINLITFMLHDLGPNTVCNVTGTGDYGNKVAHNVHTFVLKEINIDEVLNVCGNLKSKLSAGIDGMSTKLLQRVIGII